MPFDNKRIYLTVDTECHDITQQNIYLWGKVKEEEWGLRKILDLGKEYNIPINFFVDIAECKRYGVAFVKKICDLITSYNQEVYIHLHPNFISGDDSRTFLWQYSKEEIRAIVRETIAYYKELFPNKKLPAFRAGAYSVNSDFYEVLRDEFGEDVIDFSYCCEAPKMCHLSTEEVNSYNKVTKHKGCIIFPNTRFIGFGLCGTYKFLNVDTAETQLEEFKSFLSQNILKDITLTMHSWNFSKNYFLKGKVWPHKTQLKKFRKMVEYAQSHGYIFSDISKDFKLSAETRDEQIVNLCITPWGKLKSIYYNFIRFANLGRLYLKYFIIYGLFYLILVSAVLSTILFCAFK